MPLHFTRRSALALVAAVVTGLALAEEVKGTFGFAAKVDADGVFNPTLISVRIHSVQSGMPAALAGIVAGDRILEVEGIKVAGAKASAMAGRMKRKPGDAVLFKLLRASGETYVVTLVAATPKQ